MGYHYDGAAARLQILERSHECPLPYQIEAGIGFVQHHEARIAEHSAREGDALALPAG